MKTNKVMMNILMVTALTAASSAASAVGTASERPDDPLGNSGFYAGFELGYAPVSGSSQVTTANGSAIGGHGGYVFNRNVSAEIAWDFVGNFKTGLIDWSADVLSASMVGYYPVQDELDVYGKLGYASATVATSNLVNNVSKNKTGLTYGFGVELGHGKKNSFRLGMDHYDLSAWSTLPISSNNFNVSCDFRF